MSRISVLGDSIMETHLTAEGHAKHVSTLRQFTATGQTTLLEHTVTWDMTDAYWIALAGGTKEE